MLGGFNHKRLVIWQFSGYNGAIPKKMGSDNLLPILHAWEDEIIT